MQRVIGLGNPLRGDDGIGIRIVEELQAYDLPDSVELVDAGEAGLALVGLLDGVDSAVIVDCAMMGELPGRVRAFGADNVVAETADADIHSAHAGTALKLARELGMLPDLVQVVGIQPATTAWGQSLSPEVESAVGTACLIICKLLEKIPADVCSVRSEGGVTRGNTQDPDS